MISHLLAARLQLDLNQVPYASVSVAVQNTVGGQVEAPLAEPEMAERIATLGPVVDASMTLDQVAAFLRAEHAHRAAATREIGLLPE